MSMDMDMNEDEVQESEEVQHERMLRRESEHVAEQIRDHNERVQAARDFDWDAWEKETGLDRPEMHDFL